jgi:prepilin-type N-terminal cleavage/methylation domain-containing protein
MNHKFSHRRCRQQHSLTSNGFTLMELLIVMAIITILMLIGFPTYRRVIRARDSPAI